MKQIDIFACVKEKKVEKDDIEKEFDRFHDLCEDWFKNAEPAIYGEWDNKKEDKKEKK